MNRIASIPLQRTMSQAIQKSQQKLAKTQISLATGKKAHDYAALGTQTIRNLSAHSLVTQEEAHGAVSSRVGTTLQLNDTYLNQIDDSLAGLHTEIMTAIRTGSRRPSISIARRLTPARVAFRCSAGRRPTARPSSRRRWPTRLR
jgi:flagellar hook-associated protein 3 FlgL